MVLGTPPTRCRRGCPGSTPRSPPNTPPGSAKFFEHTAKSGAITAKTILLNLNGTSFTGLYQGSTKLVRGRDYAVEGDRVPPDRRGADQAERLAGLRHERGADGPLLPRRAVAVLRHHLRHPVLSDATGTTSSFAIPTAFRGDQLATMEAGYDDGADAGPNDWTSCKEYDRTFTPDYPGGRTALTPEFFASVRDDSRVTYHVTKSGGAVTGTTA
ncbi:hypothetical protein [Saccharothrix sp. 6-C]|uniref:hypothetical protein n=1 Tax=Saccharothrix sp. 6-C TaxID=2781735 RepID=UPI003FA7029D